MPGMEYLDNNPLFKVGLNVVEQGMKDFTGKTVDMLPKEVRGLTSIPRALSHAVTLIVCR